mmetsp:Transcript_3712/g.7219  ORF Transcript_3712/g.7219 Transcript_3712/m.7219 type:complete len:202 (-) Transcript_3712:297-902(-)
MAAPELLGHSIVRVGDVFQNLSLSLIHQVPEATEVRAHALQVGAVPGARAGRRARGGLHQAVHFLGSCAQGAESVRLGRILKLAHAPVLLRARSLRLPLQGLASGLHEVQLLREMVHASLLRRRLRLGVARLPRVLVGELVVLADVALAFLERIRGEGLAALGPALVVHSAPLLEHALKAPVQHGLCRLLRVEVAGLQHPK